MSHATSTERPASRILTPVAPPAPAPQTEGYIDVGDGHRLWYFDTGGSGEPVVLLHAGIGSARFWVYQQPVFAAAGYRTIGYSRRGHAASRVGDPQAMGIASDDLAIVADRLGLDSFHLVATAAGGMVAADFAISNFGRLLSLVLANTVVGVTDQDYRDIQARLRPPGFKAMPREVKELGPCYRHLDPEGTRRWKSLEAEAWLPLIPQQGFANRVTWDALARWALPVLLMTGDADPYMPPSVMELLHVRIAGSEQSIVAHCGHSAFWERPDLFNAIVLDFVRRHAGRRLERPLSAKG